MKTKKLPDETITHSLSGGIVAQTMEVDGFQKLITYKTPNMSWVHRNYRIQPKKGRKIKKGD